jgi:5-methylthioadenosine/S-adenosylhomocysteine deaminase
MDMGTLRHQEIIFEELIKSGIRAFAGKCMMDHNELFPEFSAALSDEIKYSCALAEEYHNKNSRIKYAFSPRFVLTSSEGLLKEAWEMMNSFEGSIYHTHSSENKNECSRVNELYGCDNIEYFNRIGVLGKRTVLAHCVHVNEEEKNLLSDKQVGVAHCPSSNLKLGSGIAPIPDFLERGIKVSIGSDGAACSNTLSMFNEMRTASLIQKPINGAVSMNARTIFRMATIEGARALNIETETGSIEVGKSADLVLMNLNRYNHSLSDENIYSDIVYSAGTESVVNVMVDGEWVVESGKPVFCDESSLLYDARLEIDRLIRRI